MPKRHLNNAQMSKITPKTLCLHYAYTMPTLKTLPLSYTPHLHLHLGRLLYFASIHFFVAGWRVEKAASLYFLHSSHRFSCIRCPAIFSSIFAFSLFQFSILLSFLTRSTLPIFSTPTYSTQLSPNITFIYTSISLISLPSLHNMPNTKSATSRCPTMHPGNSHH